MEEWFYCCTGLSRNAATKESAKANPAATSTRAMPPAPSASELEEPIRIRPMEELKLKYAVDWSPKGEIGRGHFAQVFLGRMRSSTKLIAAKRVARSATRGESLQNEINALSALQGHPGIVRLYDVYYDDTYMILIMEYLAGGELFSRIVKGGAYSERSASKHAKALVSALDYMHSRGVVHRDLKPENLVLCEPTLDSAIKISDFGLSKILNDDSVTMRTVCGTRAYSAPEVGLGNLPRKGTPGAHRAPVIAPYSANVDVWSLGVILFVILGAYHPFDPFGQASEQEVWKRICNQEWDFQDPVWDHVSPQAKDLLTKMIVADPAKRYTTKEVLAHEWITGAASLPDVNLQSVANRSLRNLMGSDVHTTSVPVGTMDLFSPKSSGMMIVET